MAWIKVHQGVSDHRKTLAVARVLKVDPDLVVGKLIRFWTWALDQADDDGTLPDIEYDQLGRLAGWYKRPVTFIQALVFAGFLDEEEGRVTIHDWKQYAGKLNEKRALQKKRQQVSRGKKRERASPVTRDTQQTKHSQEREQELEIEPSSANASEGAALAKGFAYKTSPPEPDEPGFVGEYQRHYEQRTGKHLPISQAADARELERDYGAAACIQVAADLNWEKPPTWMRPRLEDRKNGRLQAPQRSLAGSKGRSAGPDMDEWERYAASD